MKKHKVYFNPGDICYNENCAGSIRNPVKIVKLTNIQQQYYLVENLKDRVTYSIYNNEKGDIYRIHGSWLVPAQTQKCPEYLRTIQ